MIDVQEHFYDDDPSKGHPDVRTKLKAVSYFFLGNGCIQGAVQFAPGGEGTPVGLLIMNPEYLRKKREALTFDPDSGLEKTMVRVQSGNSFHVPQAKNVDVGWLTEYPVPAVRVQWKTRDFSVTEHFYCPDRSQPVLVREVKIRNLKKGEIQARLETGVLDRVFAHEFKLRSREETLICVRYTLDSPGAQVRLDYDLNRGPTEEALDYWEKTAAVSFGLPLLDHYFNASRVQLPAVVSEAGKMDGSIWQYNREWVRDQAMVAVGLAVSGHHELARLMLNRLIEVFVTDEGDTIDSSEKRHPDEVELDQNGVLLYALKNYVLWSGNQEIINKNWDKIMATAEFPLKDVFRHQPSGLLANRREYWERHKAHGIEEGMELAHQLWASLGLSSAAELARLTSHETEAERWDRRAEWIKHAILHHVQYGLVDDRGFIKRRKIDGSLQESAEPSPDAQLPVGVPLSSSDPHLLNPDASASLPIAFEFVSPASPVASSTMASLEGLWNQGWKGGGYGRYHLSSEPDSPGPWPFPSLFIARAYLEAGDYKKVWRVLRWLETLPGARAGSWFEFYGPRLAPPFPQVGITPWTWAEMLILLVHHIIGIQPETTYLRIRPKLLPGIKRIKALFPLRKGRVNLEIRKASKGESPGFRSNGAVTQSSDKEACIGYSEAELWIEAVLP
ncbi:MAG: hypothetical protein OEY25_08500 [Candidatus Aminicenantes bacterium]|nr:hypothetical protein [Candidatus Aminicenantes bacterium]MDH5705495.1 hypothetical protein [Candidatus Aminicenantes bacterium]